MDVDLTRCLLHLSDAYCTKACWPFRMLQLWHRMPMLRAQELKHWSCSLLFLRAWRAPLPSWRCMAAFVRA